MDVPNQQANKLPRRVVVSKVVDSRYTPGSRPVSWDERREGIEQVETENGQRITLFSSGGQSSPAPGWELLLTSKSANVVPEIEEPATRWTLFGIKRG